MAANKPPARPGTQSLPNKEDPPYTLTDVTHEYRDEQGNWTGKPQPWQTGTPPGGEGASDTDSLTGSPEAEAALQGNPPEDPAAPPLPDNSPEAQAQALGLPLSDRAGVSETLNETRDDPEAVQELSRWQRKALNRLKEGKSPASTFSSQILPPDLTAWVDAHLPYAGNVEEVRLVFRGARRRL